ncbi:group I truncated hemoglobin [Catenulispora rubra]|uniref:group I truncated hemoglobin n=1 Tax=Catenulispora rubra TaxID=280293 RepID=UPI0018926387|nr:group 1 truncated hemoglobin [Catenulispora rubra]
MSIYEAIGGAPALAAAVEDFYARVLADTELVGYFEGVDLERLKAHQRSFLAAAVGGSEIYAGRAMKEAHARLAVTQKHFDRVVGHLVDTLTELSVPADIIGDIGSKLIPLQEVIVVPAAERVRL